MPGLLFSVHISVHAHLFKHGVCRAMKTLYGAGLVVEASGAAAVAAILAGKVPDASGKKVVVVVTGGNVQPDELVKLFTTFSN